MPKARTKLSRFLIIAIICGLPLSYATAPLIGHFKVPKQEAKVPDKSARPGKKISLPSPSERFLEYGFYPAAQQEGQIGTDREHPVDSPKDNIFHVYLDQKLRGDEAIYLVYELKGVEDHTQLSRSVNEQLSIGGYLVRKNDQWTNQKERLHPAIIRKGDNVIRFSVPAGADHAYTIRNLGLEIKAEDPGLEGKPQLIVQTPVAAGSQQAYVKGMVLGKAYEQAIIHIDSQAVENKAGNFEVLLKRPEAEMEQWSVSIQAAFPDGTIQLEEVEIPYGRPFDRTYKQTAKSEVKKTAYTPSESVALSLSEARLEVPAQALSYPTTLSITALRAEDLPPLDHGMVNVTAAHEGYRFLPHGTLFNQSARLELGYDPDKLPNGKTPQDIKTYYFDEQFHTWVALERDSVLTDEQVVASITDHFTDMINAVIQVPESPETGLYTPTSIKDLKVADPAAAVVMMEAPTANPMGSATTVFPFKIPAGRQGMQPDFALRYNSEGAHSWVGLGWDLSFPAITIDTRWGVPRFNENLETETYQINGEQLFPTAHREDLVPRNAAGTKQFWRRVEGAFDRIIRYGNTPKEYFWEVTDKKGVRYFYGGRPGNGISENAILRDSEDNITHWALLEVRDLNENFVRYHCVHVETSGVPNSTILGDQLYVDRITYTGHDNEPGKYEIRFTRDREESDFQQRQDVDINARLGFKRVTADLLRRIDISFDGQSVRTYEFDYREGAFYKTLLSAITELDAEGQVFTTHNLDYFDDVRQNNTYQPLNTAQEWSPGPDKLGANFLNPIDNFNGDATVISGTKSVDFGFGMAVTVGLADGNVVMKSMTAGGHFSYSQSNNEGVALMIDINGDGLLDKVFAKDGQIFYRPNQSGPEGDLVFGEDDPVIGIGGNYYKEKSRTKGIGVEAHVGYSVVGGFTGSSFNTTESVTDTYFEDVNGDQLIDLVKNGRVFFNHIDPNTGHPTFTSFSADTPSPIGEDVAVDAAFGELDEAVEQRNIEENPLHDVVRMWEAPFAGDIRVRGTIRLIEDNNQLRAEYETADGIRAAIQQEGSEQWHTDISAENYGSTSHDITLSVSKDDRIFFRLQSIFDGAYDQVYWDPTIEYIVPDEIKDSVNINQEPLFQYKASDDFLLSGPVSVTAPIDGVIRFAGKFSKPITTDDVKLEIWQTVPGTFPEERMLYDTITFTANQSVNTDYTFERTVQAGDEFWYRVTSRTNVNWAQVKWSPELYYIQSLDSNFPNSLIINDQDTLLKFKPTVDYWIYPDQFRPTEYWSKDIPTLESVEVTPQLGPLLNINLPFFDPGIQDTSSITFSVKRADKPVQYKVFKFFGKSILNPGGDLTIKIEDIEPNEQLLIEYHATDRRLERFIAKSAADIKYRYTIEILGIEIPIEETDSDWPVAFHMTKSRDIEDDSYNLQDRSTILFGPMYRGWGQFIYNGNPDRDDQPIDRSLLKLDEDLKNDPEQDTSNAYSPAKSMFVMMVPFADEGLWRGYDNWAYLKADTMSSSRMGQDYPKQITPLPQNGGTVVTRAIRKKTQATSLSGAAGISVLVVNGSYSSTEGNTRVVTDFLDTNGDQYPDVVSHNRIQYTTAQGVLEPEAQSIPDLGYSDLANNNAEGGTLGGSYVTSEGSGGNAQVDPKKVSFQVGGGKSSVGLSVNYGTGDNNTAYSLRDINGDGLPDRVFSDGRVALNLGYGFAAHEVWGHTAVRKGESKSFGGGLGINLGNASIVAGFGLSRSDSSVKEALQDVNGDGLLDVVIDGNPIKVRLNTGNGFMGEIPWTGATSISEGSSSTESLNVAFTGCIIIPIISIKICFNPSTNVGQSASREKTGIRDVDGDGYPDYLVSSASDSLRVATSRIGRTNKLRSIQRPLGSSVTMDYRRVGNSYAMPNSVWTLDRVEVYDGFNGDGADRMLTTFEYEDGFFDRHEREFYGFGRISSHELDTENGNEVYRTRIQQFTNSNYYEKELLTSDILEDGDGNKFTEVRYQYQLHDVRTGDPLPATFVTDDAGAAFPAVVREERLFYEGQASAQKQTAFQYRYDRFGNNIFYQDLGENSPDDDLAADITFHSFPDKHLVGIFESIIVRNNAGQIFRKRETDIDENTGNVTQIRQYLEDGTTAVYDLSYDTYGNIETLNRPENHLGERLAFSYEYDQPTNIYNTKVSDSYGYSSSATYDLRFGQMLSSTDMNGQRILYEIDELGRITQVQGPYEIANNIPFTIRHEYHPEANIPWALTQHYDPSNPGNFIETAIFIDGLARELQVKKDAAIFLGEAIPDREEMIVTGETLFDAFGRSVSVRYPVTEPKGTTGNYNTGVDNVSPIFTTYDVLDRPLTVTLPDNSQTSYTYSFGEDRASLIQFLTSIEDPNGNIKDQFTDVRGRQVATKDYLDDGNDHIWNTYSYNAINELIQVTDHDGNAIISEYDWLGRHTRRIHPDAGTTDYEYDLASNLTAKITENLRQAGNNLAIEYIYDRERLEEIRYPLNPDNNVRYEYGDPGENFFRAGRILRQIDATGEQTFFYGRLGEVIKNIREVVLGNGQGRSFTTRWTYDTWNRVTSMVYPDLEILTYDYNVGGKLRSVQGSKRGFTYEYLTQLGYDKFEQKVFQSHGNGTATTYAYEDDRRRLNHMVATTALGRPIMDNTYEYDRVTNIKRITNNAPLPAFNQMGGASEYRYEYDDLYRLVKAEGGWRNRYSAQRFGLEMEYNKLHDIVNKRQVHQRRLPPSLGWKTSKQTTYDLNYTYDSSQPHTATQVGGHSYAYDGNGNMISRVNDVFYGQTRHLSWDEEDRLMLLDDDERRHVYTYDADDTRVIKRKDIGQYVFINGELVTQSENVGDYTVYVGPHLVINAAGYTKHFFIENQRITSKLGGGGPYGLGSSWGDWENWSYWEDWDNLANANDWDKIDEPYRPEDEISGTDNWSDWGYGRELYEYYFHPDHLGSNSFITDALGEVHQHLEYLPYGEIFVDEHRNIDRTSYLFNGKELDEETGLYYYGARYYDPQISRWLSVDPMAEKYAGWSPFNYALNNPITYTDPDGQIPLDVIWDAANVVADLGRGIYHEVAGNDEAANAAWTDLALDAGALLIPYVPAGVSKLKYADEVVDVAKGIDKSTDAAKAAKTGTRGGERAGKDFTKKGKQEVIDANKKKNAGKTVCEDCGTKTVPAKKSEKGVKPPGNETQVDHIYPKSKGGDGAPPNGQVLCRDCNRTKGNKTPSEHYKKE